MIQTTDKRDPYITTLSQPQMPSTRVATGTLGFTVTELLLVLVLIGVLSAISMPALKGFAATRRLKASAYSLRSLLTFARDMAITDRTTYLVVLNLDNGQYWLASSETFNPSNPHSSALTARNSTALAAIQNNINNVNRTRVPNGNSVQQNPLSRASGILGVPYAMEQNVTLALMVTNYNGRMVQADSGVAYIHFSTHATSEENTCVPPKLTKSDHVCQCRSSEWTCPCSPTRTWRDRNVRV